MQKNRLSHHFTIWF